jgi:hypothetical protein
MKNKLCVFCFLFASFFSNAQNVGIGTTAPLARLHVTDSSVVFSAVGSVPIVPGKPPISGEGRRLMWYADRAAFRVGYVNTTSWDKDSVGDYSAALGNNNKASGYSSFAAGNTNLASGTNSIAFGFGTTASGDFSTATGNYTTASSYGSTAIGYYTISSGYNSFGAGTLCVASGAFSTALGNSAISSGLNSAAFGAAANASGSNSTAMGSYTNASGYFSTAMGKNTIASGNTSTAMGSFTNASGSISTAIGSTAQANSDYSVAIGESVTANSWISTSLGRHNDPIVSSPTSSWALTEPLLIVGNGTDASDKKNAFAIAKNGNIYIDPSNKNDGNLFGNTLLFGTFNGTGEGISSRRTAGPNQFGLDIYASSYIRMSITNAGNVGIGTTAPNAPLGFPATLGKKITLYPGATGDVGMAVQGNLFQIYSDNPNADIAFGYDQAGTMTERMRVKANGNVGIGTTNPAAKLQISSGDASFALFGPSSYGGLLYVGASAINQSTTLTAQVVASDGNLHIDPAAGKNIYVGYYQGRDIFLNPFSGKVGIGTTTPATTLEVNGYSKFGSNAPSVKMLKLTGTTAATQGGFVVIPHGLDYSKILSVSVLVYTAAGGIWVPSSFHTFSGSEFNWFSGLTSIRVDNVSSNSASILSAPIRILIAYEE